MLSSEIYYQPNKDGINTNQNISIYSHNQNLTGTIYKRSISMLNITSTIFTVYQSNQTNYLSMFKNGLGFIHHFNNIQFSLTHTLYLNNQIKKNQFAFKPSLSKFGGKVYFGELPREAISYAMDGGICNVKRNAQLWGCEWKYISVGDSIYYIFDILSFRTEEFKILVPPKFMEFWNTTIFKPKINDGICRYKKGYFTSNFECDCAIRDIIKGNISISIGDYAYEIEIEKLFELKGNKNENCEFFISSLKEGEGNKDEKDDSISNRWVFGTSFLENFLSVFDYDESRVILYSDTVAISKDKLWGEDGSSKNFNWLNRILLVNIIILLYGVLTNAALRLDIF